MTKLHPPLEDCNSILKFLPENPKGSSSSLVGDLEPLVTDMFVDSSDGGCHPTVLQFETLIRAHVFTVAHNSADRTSPVRTFLLDGTDVDLAPCGVLVLLLRDDFVR